MKFTSINRFFDARFIVGKLNRQSRPPAAEREGLRAEQQAFRRREEAEGLRGIRIRGKPPPTFSSSAPR